MELYAQANQRTAALRQYRACMRVLEEELSVGPSDETTALYQRIRAGKVGRVEREVIAPTPTPPPFPPIHPPPFISGDQEPAEVERSVFVAREPELAQLGRSLDAALAGEGQVVFVTGGAGRGKTALMEEFARRAQSAYPDLLVAIGNCNAYGGVGDPYLPFRELLGMLTGDVEARWAAGTITREMACRLWALLPIAVQALLDHGSSLIGIFLSGVALSSRAAAVAPDGAGWLAQLKELSEREKAEPGNGSTEALTVGPPTALRTGSVESPQVLAQSQLFEQYTDVLHALAAQRPLLLVLDNMQWADAASISLFFHLGLRLKGSRILIVSGYRPDEVAFGRPATLPTAAGQRERHPLEKVLAEFKRCFGDVWVDLTRADEMEGRRFVEAFLDTEPNQLEEDFRGALFGRTGGHPLFTVELLRAMQERGDLVQGGDGEWVEGPALHWERLPARVEAVIEERVGRLDEGLRDILTVASVEGEAFTAQVVAGVQDIVEREILRALSQELGTRHRLVREREEVQMGGQFLSHYQFAHVLFQRYLYNGLGAGERRLLHGEIAVALEELYGDRAAEIAPQLARHYAEAGEGEKAVEYFLHAGDQARLAYAHAEAVDHYRRALTFLQEGGKHGRAARTLMKLGLAYHNGFDFRRARQAYEEGFALWQRAGKTQPADLPTAPHALRMRWFNPTTLDPIRVADTFSTGVIGRLFSGLVEQSPEMGIVPDVAQAWDVQENGRRYIFRLRDDVYWSDGELVTAADFEYAWRRMLDPASGSSQASLLYDIKGARAFHQGEGVWQDVGVQASDDVTLVVELEEPTGYFLHLMASLAPVPRHVVKALGEAWTDVGNIVTNGPFRLEAWQQGESMVLARYAEYHGRFTGNVEKVELSLLLDPSVQLEIYEAGDLDALDITWFPPAEIAAARQRHAGEYVSAPLLLTTYVGFDVNRPPFDDPRVRRAFVLATDREMLADVALQGYVFPATGGFVPPGIPGHSPGIGLPYDPAGARLLLAEAGYPDGRGFPVVDALLPRAAIVRAGCEYQQAQWQENLGVEVAWEGIKLATLLDKLRQEPPHMHVLAWSADYPDPDNFLRVGVPREATGWQNESYSRLMEKARRVMDQEERMELYGQAETILVEESPIMPLYYMRQHLLVKPWVSKFPISAINHWFWKDIIIEPH